MPITIGIVPFGAVMGTVCADAQLSLFQSVGMNVFVFAGAAQLAAIELMSKNAESFVVLATGLIINLRFILYSAALSPVVQNASPLTKVSSAYLLTDQTYAVMSAHQHRFETTSDVVKFYFGAAVCMAIAWHLAVVAGFTFGSFAPKSFALDYAVPLSFVTLVVPTLKNRIYVYVMVLSFVLAIFMKSLPFNLGLVVTALVALAVGVFLSRPQARTVLSRSKVRTEGDV